MKKKSPIIIALAKRIRARREALGFSQEGFADFIDYDRSTWGAIERGERNVSAFNLARIAKGLQCEVGELFPPLSELKKLFNEQKRMAKDD